MTAAQALVPAPGAPLAPDRALAELLERRYGRINGDATGAFLVGKIRPQEEQDPHSYSQKGERRWSTSAGNTFQLVETVNHALGTV